MNNEEMNRLIAEKVMGWELTKLDVVDAWIDKEDKWTLKQMWKPTTDIRDAWEVIDKFTAYKLGDTFDVKHRCSLFINGRWHTEYDEKVERAICKASLKAKGVDINEYSK